MSINIVESIATANKCYQAAIPLYPQGIMLHSIGCPQPSAAEVKADLLAVAAHIPKGQRKKYGAELERILAKYDG